LLGERLDTGRWNATSLGVAPLAVNIPEGGVAVEFRYGAVVLFETATPAMDNFIASLAPSVTGVLPVSERDDVRLLVRRDADQHIDLAGNIFRPEKTGNPVDFHSAGAYTASYASMEFNGFPPLRTYCI
jgi:hypothetical protein